jgi:hypothetical protein
VVGKIGETKMEENKESKIVIDGKEFVLSPLNVGDLIAIEKQFGSLQLDTTKFENIVYYVWLSLKKKSPMTLEQFYEVVTVPFISKGGLIEIFQKLAKLNGWDTLPNEKASTVAVEKV